MAGKKENIKALFSNSRTRVIILFTVILLAITIVIGVIKFGASSGSHDAGASVSSSAGNISSIPGNINQTAQYAALQATQNLEQAQFAQQTGTSAIPTIIRTHAFGEGVQIIGQKEGESGVDFSALTNDISGETQKFAWVDILKQSGCNKISIDKVIAQGGAFSDLKTTCSCGQLKNAGYKVGELEPVCTCSELKAAGFDIVQLKEAGFSAGRLRLCGYVACDERGVGFTAQAMKDAGFSDGELKGAGFTEQEIARAGGLPDGITSADVQKAACETSALTRLHVAGVSAAAIRRISGCGADKLKAAGFTAEDLNNAGFSAADLKNAGFNAAALRAAGFGVRDLLNAGFTGEDLANAGFSTAEITAAEALLPLGLTPDDVKKAGCSAAAIKRQRLTGISAELIQKYAGCAAAAKLSAGKPSSSIDDATIRAASCDSAKLKVLLAQGVTADRIHQLNGCSIDVLKAAGFDAKSLADAGFTPEELLAAGFTPDQLIQAGLSPTGIIAAGRTADCSVKSLTAAHQLGVSAGTIKQTLGCNATALSAAGFSAADLKNAGFTAAELKNAGLSLADLKNAGFSAKDLAAAGWTAKQLNDAGFTALQLKAAGLSAADLKNAGMSAQPLKEAGFSATELTQAGFSPEQLKAAGFNAAALKEAGVAADALRKAGFSAGDLKAAGFSSDDVKQAGYASQDMRDAGFSVVAGLDAVTPLPAIMSTLPNGPPFGVSDTGAAAIAAANAKRIDEIRNQQEKQAAAQRYQQKIQQRGSAMLTAANQALQGWRVAPQQSYIGGSEKGDENNPGSYIASNDMQLGSGKAAGIEVTNNSKGPVVIRTGDILFAVIDTSVNSDEPGPILATIVSGKLTGSKLIGSFQLPGKADKMIVTFNTLSIPGASDTVGITAFAIDPNTARTALSSQTDHHYLSRYGSLFASTFLEGFGNAFQSSNTTISIGGTGGTTNTTIQSGIGRSTLDNAVIGLATLGKAWGQVAAQNMSRPTTVQLYAGTGVGILFTQNLTLT